MPLKTSALTHGHPAGQLAAPAGQLAASAWAELLAGGAQGEGVEGCARKKGAVYSDLAYESLNLSSVGQVVASVIDATLAVKRDCKPSVVSKLGKGWIANNIIS